MDLRGSGKLEEMREHWELCRGDLVPEGRVGNERAVQGKGLRNASGQYGGPALLPPHPSGIFDKSPISRQA